MSSLPGSPPFHLSVEHQADRTLIAMAGELDMGCADQLRAALIPVSGPGGVLVIDLRRLEFMDSSGLRAILEAAEWAGRRQWRFALVRGPRPVHRVFELCRLEGVLEFVDDPADLPGAEPNSLAATSQG